MKKNSNSKKTVIKIRKIACKRAMIELSEIGAKRDKELQEMDRIAKLLIKRDLILNETVVKRDKELQEMDRIAKLLVKRDLKLNETVVQLKEAQREAEEEKNKTSAIITNFADGLLFFDKENNLSLINPQAEDFLGTKGKDIIGKSILGLSKVAVLKPLVELYKKETKEFFRKELKIGDDLILEMSMVLVTREKEELGNLVILHNVTREKLVEKMKTEFVSLTAHQLRTPLSAIKWTVKMVLDEELGKINKEQKEFLQDSYKSNERMIALVNDLLSVARIEEGKYIFMPISTDIEKIIKNAIDFYKEEIKKEGVKIEFIGPKKKLPKLMLDVEKIQITLDNLIRNAVRYTSRGGKVTVSLKHGKKEIEVSIKDTGVGIPKQQQKRIFTKFFRAANVIRMETEGTGLGLYIAKNIIEAHGGRIWFESKEKKGTTFYFTLPIK